MKTSKFVSKSQPEIDTFAHKIQKIALHIYEDFGFHGVRSPTSLNFRIHKTFVLLRFLLQKYISITHLYILLV